MNQQRKKIARFHFAGEVYDGHALDVAALEELVQFQKIVTEVAKVIWKSKHPDRSRLPNDFEKSTKFYFNTVQQGGAIVPLELPIASNGYNLFGDSNVVTQAIDLTYDAFVAVNRNEPLPANIPRRILQKIAKLGGKLPEKSELFFAPHAKSMEPISKESRTRLAAIVNNSYKDELDIIGKVLEADIKRRKFQLWVNDQDSISIPFTQEQEHKITTALKDHIVTQVRVKGNAEFNSQGHLQKVIEIYDINIYNEDSDVDHNAPNINEEIDNIFGNVSDDIWKNIPSDLSHRHDFYVYGITELPSTIEDFIDYIKGPESPNKKYFTSCKDQVIEWAREFGAVENCGRCSGEPVIDLDFLQERIMRYYIVPDERCVEISDVLMSLSNMGISTEGVVCDNCESKMKNDN